jgi:hypothetical protein
MCFFVRYKIKRLNKKINSLYQARIHNQPSEEARKKEINYYHTLAKIYYSLEGKKKYPFARTLMLTCYQASSQLDDVDASYIVGKNLLDEGKFRLEIQQNNALANLSNERQMNEVFKEAHAYLLAAEKLDSPKAKRLRGLAYINGWGVESDKKLGFDLIMASIDDENSWEKVPQIFAALGLNKPEFYAALAQHKKGQ